MTSLTQKELCARNTERLEQIETRLKERRDAEKEIFSRLDEIKSSISWINSSLSKDMAEFKIEFVGWKTRVQVVGALAILIIPAIITLVVEKLL